VEKLAILLYCRARVANEQVPKIQYFHEVLFSVIGAFSFR
jgi:hypothetical protein